MAVEDRPGDSLRSVREAIALAIHTVVHIGIDRSKGERRITQVLRVEGYNPTEDKFLTTPLYTIGFDAGRRSARGALTKPQWGAAVHRENHG
jgi:hypothetical protein